MEKDLKEFIKMLDFTNGKFHNTIVYEDVIRITAYFIALEYEPEYKTKIEELTRKYTSEERGKLIYLSYRLTNIYQKQEKPIDILGQIYHLINLNNKQTGQFFTPPHIQNLCADIMLNEEEIKKEKIILNEPSCGSGGMPIAYAKALLEKGYNPKEKLIVHANDLDQLCSYMAFLQLSMYDIPAVVTNGDGLSNSKANFILYTPVYIENKRLERINRFWK